MKQRIKPEELKSLQAPIKEKYRRPVSSLTPVGFQRIRLQFDLDIDASEEQLATLLCLTERYCVVYQTLNQSPKIDIVRRETSP